MIDSIEFVSESLSIDSDHPCLPGHFPGQPVVPAVVGLQTVTDVLTAERPYWQLLGIRQAKFMNPLLPEEPFTIELSGKLPNIEFKCVSGDRLIARGSLEMGLSAA